MGLAEVGLKPDRKAAAAVEDIREKQGLRPPPTTIDQDRRIHGVAHVSRLDDTQDPG